MSKVISAGILLECEGKFLLGHPTELTGTTHGWGILKGKLDKKEPLIVAALREFEEKSGLNLLMYPGVHFIARPFYSYRVGSKEVFVFWFTCTPSNGIMKLKLQCPSLVEGTTKPEIDDYKWVDVDEAIKMVTDSQKDLFKTVKQLTRYS